MKENNKIKEEKAFTHLYIEQDAYKYSATERIKNKLKYAKIVNIRHYKDVFAIENQNAIKEKKSPNIILAVNRNKFLYVGSENCQAFGMDKYYYLLMAMNCPFDCDYCFLKGMYPSANIVIFVNIEDAIKEIDERIGKGKALINLSYETDLIALEGIVEYVEIWNEYALNRQNIQMEIRTKAAVDYSKRNSDLKNVVMAFTLSPDEIIDRFEHNTPKLSKRILSVNTALDKGAKVRLCFDPMLHIKGYEEIYGSFFRQLVEEIDFTKIYDVSIGTFRMPLDYLKNLRKRYGESEITLYPYEREGKNAHYRMDTENKLIKIARDNLEKVMPKEKIFEIKE